MTTVLCTTCTEAPAKYKCPACPSNTCSLACSKTHKSLTKCSGKRSQTTFIPRSKFDDASINNDYNFLTTLERDLDNAARLQAERPGGRNISQVKAFVKRAKDVGEVTVQLAPRGMKRARTNKSAWVPKKGQLSWTVEWLFEGDTSRMSDRVLDSSVLKDAAGYAKTKVDATIDGYKDVAVQDLHFLIKNEGTDTREPIYSILDCEKTLGEALRHRTVVEYPTIHVYRQIPAHLKLERQYSYVQPSVESLATSLVKSKADTSTPNKDFIAFNMDGDASESSEEQESPADKTTATNRLPVIDFDDLNVPYS